LSANDAVERHPWGPELGIISAKGRNGTAKLLEMIADEQDDRIPAAARFSLAVAAG
jgi:transposase